MHSLNDPYWQQPTQLEKLKTVLGCEQVIVLSKQSGGNSVVYCIQADHKRYAVKIYPPYAPGGRDRLTSELLVYQFYLKKKICTVPKLQAFCEKERWLIIEWIDGKKIDHYTTSDIQQALDFIHLTAKLGQDPEAATLPQAAEPCLSLKALIDQVDRRWQRLLNQPEQDKSLYDFLSNEFRAVFQQLCQRAVHGYQSLGVEIDTDISFEKRALIPADFGFHNIICDQSGQLYFFDFDYFGWDDPVKLLSDILWHPKMDLSEPQITQFIDGFAVIFASDANFLARFDYHFPLFGLRWVLILLNEFITEFWQNRQHAMVYDNRHEAKNAQLQRAKVLLQRVQQQTGCLI
ncbi:MAG: aminoglycoside phosphotransferase family protein [Gammaproteobacteria bacterium]|nr:aminoglycoside phosphotransferase family protein [Gammaproteobacteria bacterium]